ncbi:MAG: helix-turn-helix transcriptional regulator [Actinomycetota bacterium]|nr:helix-turn-helix transcriptional regulator [Actinomycetota bacterium]
MNTVAERPAIGMLLREWRRRRHLSQLDLSSEAGVSSRHVSFIETGRAKPSRAMVLQLADMLAVPLREQNQLLIAAGYAPTFRERRLDDPDMAAVRSGLEIVLHGYEPFPCLVVDRGWNLLLANSGINALLVGAAPHLLEPPVNVLRLSLHPEGLAPQIRNLAQWRAHVLGRLAREATVSGSAVLADLHTELLAYPGGLEDHNAEEIAVPLRIEVGGIELAFMSTVTTFGTALDLTAAELTIEAFLPADETTAVAVRQLSEQPDLR